MDYSEFEILALRTLLLGRETFLRALNSIAYLSVHIFDVKLSIATADV